MSSFPDEWPFLVYRGCSEVTINPIARKKLRNFAEKKKPGDKRFVEELNTNYVLR